MKPEIVQLNLENEICPYTLILTIRKSKEIKSDLDSGKKILEVFVDHSPTTDNLPIEFSKRGYQVDVEKLGSGRWKFVIKK
jgi:TusA-related sulfurtransferase